MYSDDTRHDYQYQAKDNGTWGNILNEFLGVEHNADGTLKANGTIAGKADDSAVVSQSLFQTHRGRIFATVKKRYLCFTNKQLIVEVIDRGLPPDRLHQR